MKHWFPVFTKPRAEGLAEEHLRRQGYGVFLPLCENSRRRRGRWVRVIESLFPRYLFVQLDPGSDNFAPIRSTRGVIGLVRFGGTPRPVPAEFMDRLIAGADGDTGLFPIHPRGFRPGEQVDVVDGPFQGLRGIFDAETAEDRVTVLLEFLGRKNPVFLKKHQVIAAG